MRLLGLFSFSLLMVSALTAQAQRDTNGVFLEPDDSITEATTGRSFKLLKAAGGLRPADCPPDAYYRISPGTVAKCADGSRYAIPATTGSGSVKAQVPVRDRIFFRFVPPKDTDEPGPYRK